MFYYVKPSSIFLKPKKTKVLIKPGLESSLIQPNVEVKYIHSIFFLISKTRLIDSITICNLLLIVYLYFFWKVDLKSQNKIKPRLSKTLGLC